MSDIFLRVLESSDLERTYKWHNDVNIYSTLAGPYRFVSHAAEEEWLQKKQAYSTQEINLAICLKPDSIHIGNIYIRNIDWISRNGELSGILIGEPKYRSLGYGAESLNQMKQHCFFDLGFKRIYALVLEENLASKRMFEKCGFVVEGNLKNHAFKHGEFKNVLVMGLCKD